MARYRYVCEADNCKMEISAASPREAAEEFISSGSYPEESETYWVSVYVRPADAGPEDGEYIKVAIDPEEPPCDLGEHDWQSPHEVVGGLPENPGVFGHGGGAKKITVCAHCGVYRIWDGWAADPEDGEQGLESVSYQDADEKSEEWAETQDK